jgi:chloramphenicol O-acetyltransferase type A
MIFTEINMKTWERKEHFLHYDQQVNCYHCTTYNINVKNLLKNIHKNKYNFYRTFIYIVSKTINSIENFKIGIDKNNIVGYYDFISPSYLIFHEDTKTFSCAFTEYNNNFEIFYKNISEDIEKYKIEHKFIAMDIPKNSFDISCLPWIKYNSINLEIPLNHKHYAPIITWGKYEKEWNKVNMPLTIQINHAVADGYHIGLFFNGVQKICNEFK